VERQLVERAQQGDPEAFDRLTELIMDRLFSVAYRILVNASYAEYRRRGLGPPDAAAG
jgi:DNA-directed RNA polymerase specialized sigma24 family protein